MGAEGYQVEAIAVDVDRNLSYSLGGVCKEQHAMAAGDMAYLLYRLYHPDLIIGIHDGDEHGRGPDSGFQFRQADHTLLIYRQPCHFGAEPFEVVAGVEHGLVFGDHGDDM